MSIKTAIIIFVVACLVLVGSITFFIFRVPKENTEYRSAMETTVSQEVAAQAQQKEKDLNKTIKTENISATNKVLCAQQEKEKTLAQGVDYERGSILVSFSLQTNFDQAKSVIDEYKLKLADNAAGTFATSRWFRVIVEKEKEFDWMCTLKADVRVKYATIDPILYLNQ